ncbi:MAG: o-succinylbenzoate synthase [Acidobacteria bacterium]|nr:o-succinylbenzoate synthase [Acidobacteriota bacterium]
MRIKRVALREIHLPLVHFFETSFGRSEVRRILLVELETDGLSGWSECTAQEGPYFSHETVETAWHVIGDFIVPLILSSEIEHPGRLPRRIAQIRGHNMAKGAVEAGLWELFARCEGRSLCRAIGGTRSWIDCGVSIGIQNDVPGLLAKIERELDAGYRKVKVKIKPGWDLAVIDNVRKRFPDTPLMVDANSAYSLRDVELFRQLDDFNLLMIEQPLRHDDLLEHAQLQALLQTPLCLDESIRSYYDAKAALSLGSCRIINIKLGRVGGFAEARRIHDLCCAQNIPVWCGGMLESGIGRAHNIALSSLAGFTIPGDVSASSRYFRKDTTTRPIEVSPKGQIQVPAGLGSGYEPDVPFIESVTVRKQEFRRSLRGNH